MVGKRWTEKQTAAWERFQARETERLDRLALLPDGSPAWEAAKALPGMSPKVFELRLKRGWSPERAASEPVKQRRSKPHGMSWGAAGYDDD